MFNAIGQQKKDNIFLALAERDFGVLSKSLDLTKIYHQYF